MGVHKRGEKFVAQGWDATEGKNVHLGTFDTKKEAKAALAKRQLDQPLSAITVAEWRTRWLATPAWRTSTMKHNTERTSRFAAAHGSKKITKINRTIARDWVDERPGDLTALSAMFGAAQYADNEHGDPLLAYNPFSKLGKRKAAKRDLRADWLGEDDLRRLEEAALLVHGESVGRTLACMIRFAAETGVRPGELYLIEHGDLDVDAGVLHVRRALSKQGLVELPKNGQQREVVLSATAAQAAATAPAGDTARIFSTRAGRRWDQRSLSAHWGPVKRAAGREAMHFYELRHYCATRLLELGLRDDEVAVQLGHTDGGELVRKVYGHPNNRRALDRVREALDGRAA